MADIRAFVGHSFTAEDETCIRNILDFFRELESSLPSFRWDHAKAAESKDISEKVLAKMEGKNLFIGICTRKERVLVEQKRGFFQRLNPNYIWKPSDWVIQEIGLAVGRGMKVIILLEDEVRKPGDLQGNIEYIPFSRGRVEACFIPLLQMIKSISPAQSISASPGSVEAITAEREHDDGRAATDWKTPQPTWDGLTHRVGMMVAIENDDATAMAEISEAYLSKFGQQPEEKADWLAFVESYQITIGKSGGSLSNLKSIYNANSDNAEVASTYARTLLKFDSYEKAAEILKQTAGKLKDQRKALRCLGEAAVCLQKAGDGKQALEIVSDMIRSSNGDIDVEAVLLQALASYFNNTDDKELVLPVLDRLLEIHPTDTDVRFNLGYACSEMGLNYLSFYQYSRIPEAQRSSTAWNNLGVASQECKMPINAVRSYSKAVESSDSLAMSNMAKIYLRAGMLEDARQLLDEASKVPDHHKNVDSTIAEAVEAEEAEMEKSAELVARARPASRFLQAFGRALTRYEDKSVEGTWAHPACTLQVSIHETWFQADGSYLSEPAPLNSLIGLGLPVTKPAAARNLSLNVQGKWLGSAGLVVISKREVGKVYRSLLDTVGEVSQALIYFSKETDELMVFKNFKQENGKMYAMKRASVS